MDTIRIQRRFGQVLQLSAACIIVVLSADPAAVPRSFAVGPDPPEIGFGDEGTDGGLAIVSAEDPVIVLEINECRGTDPALLAGLAAQGRAASVYWSVNFDSTVSFAEDGEVLLADELLGVWEDEDEERLGPRFWALLGDLDFGDPTLDPRHLGVLPSEVGKPGSGRDLADCGVGPVVVVVVDPCCQGIAAG